MKKILSLVLAFTTILQAFALDNIKVDTAFTNGAAPVVARIGLAVSVNAGMTELLKSSIDEWRPDHSAQDSWPSRHTSWAYTRDDAPALRRCGWDVPFGCRSRGAHDIEQPPDAAVPLLDDRRTGLSPMGSRDRGSDTDTTLYGRDVAAGKASQYPRAWR